MVFLNPTILLGLLAASIPIVLHFLNLRKIKKVEFSTLSFLKELQKSKIRKIKIKQLLLLLLRILIILFLVASFARPTLESSKLSAIGSQAKTTAVFVLDNSFSMSVVNKNGSYLNQAKEKIKKIISNFENGDKLFLILTSNNSKNLTPLKTIKEIENVEISNISKPLVSSIKRALEIADNSNNYNKEIFIFSDFQESTFFEKDSTTVSLKNSGAKFFLFNFAGNNIQNTSINKTIFNNQIFELNKEITITSEIISHDVAATNDVLVSLFFNNKRVAQKNISQTQSGSELLKFSATINSTGLTEVVTEIEDDAIENDNKYFSHFFVPDNINLLIISKTKVSSRFIRAALSTNNSTEFNIKNILPEELKSTNLDNYKTIVIIGSEVNESSLLLKQFVEAGGNILLFPDDNKEAFNNLLESLSIPKATKIVSSNDINSANEFERIDFKHPIFNGLFKKREKEIDSPQILKYIKTNLSGNGRFIIMLQDNSPFLSEFNLGKGKILLFSVVPTLEWSNFPIKNIFAPLINRSISYLNIHITKQKNIFAGTTLLVDVSKRKSSQIKVVKPDGSTEFINHDFKSGNYLKYKNTDNIGTYKFYSNNDLLDVKSVNVNQKESELEQIEMEMLTTEIKESENTVVNINLQDDYLTKIKTARYGSELWKIFLIIALLLALVEMYVAKSAKKDLVELGN